MWKTCILWLTSYITIYNAFHAFGEITYSFKHFVPLFILFIEILIIVDLNLRYKYQRMTFYYILLATLACYDSVERFYFTIHVHEESDILMNCVYYWDYCLRPVMGNVCFSLWAASAFVMWIFLLSWKLEALRHNPISQMSISWILMRFALVNRARPTQCLIYCPHTYH